MKASRHNRQMFSDYVVFVDESGDHGLEKIDPAFPVFVLSFCIFEKVCYAERVAPAIRRLKIDTFGHDMTVLHESEIVRGKGAFSTFDEAARSAFMNKLGALIGECDFTLVAVVIHKPKHKAQYSDPNHPYHFGMQLGLERLHDFLAVKGVPTEALTHVICEARGAPEDAALAAAFEGVCGGDNRNKKSYPFQLVMADKKSNSEGLQLADLTARPIGLSVFKPQPNQAFEILKPKFFMGRGGHTYHGNGYKIFP